MSPDQIFLTANGRRISLAQLLEMDPSKITDVCVENCPGLTALPELPAATDVWVLNCPGLTALPELPAATDVCVENCPAIVNFIQAGEDRRGYKFAGVKLMGQWRVIAGCRNYNLEDARKHWGPGGESDRPDCQVLVEKIAAGIAALETSKTVEAGDADAA